MAHPQIYLFTGENTFAIAEEEQRWRAKFTEKYGDSSPITVFPGEGVTRAALLAEAGTAPFLADRRLVLFQGIPDIERADIEEVERHLHPQVLLVFLHPTEEKKPAPHVKALLALATVKAFPLLSEAALLRWLQQQAAARKVDLREDTAQCLLRRVGKDQWFLTAELSKLCLLRKSPLTPEDVVATCCPAGSAVAWHWGDLLAQGNASRVLQELHLMVEGGEDPTFLWNIFLWNLRRAITQALDAGSGGGHPARGQRHSRSAVLLSQRLQTLGLESCIDRLRILDTAVKTGRVRSTSEEPQELLALMEREILSLSTT